MLYHLLISRVGQVSGLPSSRAASWMWVLLLALLSACSGVQPVSMDSLHETVVTLRRQGDFAKALRETERGMRLTKATSPLLYWKFYLEKAEIVQQAQGGGPAQALLQQGPPDTPEFADLQARWKLDQGWAEYSLSNFREAGKRFDEAFAIANRANAQARMAGIEFSQGQLLSRLKMPEEAEARIRDGNQRAASLGDKDLTAYGAHSLALLLIYQSRFEDALRAVEPRLDFIAQTKNRRALALVLIDLGWCHYRLGELERALALFRRAAQLSQAAGDLVNSQIALGDMGNVYKDQHDFAAARKYYEQALSISSSRHLDIWTARWLSNLASISIANQDWDHASEFNARALTLKTELNDKTAQLYSLINSARILAGRRRAAEAEARFQQVIHEKSDDPAPELEAHAGLAELYAHAGQDAKATAQFEAALRVMEQTRSALIADETKMNFLSSLIEVHQDYVDFLMARGKTERGLEVAEASRARILQERVGKEEVTRTLSAATYRALARESGAVLVSYWLAPKRSFVWVTTGEGVITYPLPPEQKLLPLIENYRAFIENLHDPLDSEDASGRELYQALLAPVRDRIPVGSKVVVVPDAGLSALNFETLPVPGPKPHYFIEDATVSVAPSLNLLARRPSSRTKPVKGLGKLLLIGDPAFSSEQYPKLPYAAKEIDSIQGHFPPASVRAYREAGAVPAVYHEAAPGEFAYVHFTAHASANRENPLDSAIILAGPSGANKLTARDVLKRRVDADLVTISACRGAGAKTYAGEGLVGFMWAFFQAGAGHVIAGLWDVSDESTPRLMDDLYGRLTKGERPGEALRAAKLDLMRGSQTYSLPYYWGPFQLYIQHI